jgi:hypothetical protein
MQVKLTEHFIENAGRRLTPSARAKLWNLIFDGQLGELAKQVPEGMKGAVCIGPAWIIFCVDETDEFHVALLTAMPPNMGMVIGRRRDTIKLNLKRGIK